MQSLCSDEERLSCLSSDTHAILLLLSYSEETISSFNRTSIVAHVLCNDHDCNAVQSLITVTKLSCYSRAIGAQSNRCTITIICNATAEKLWCNRRSISSSCTIYLTVFAQSTYNRSAITNFTNNRLTDIFLTKDGSKRTNHVLQSSQPITSRLN